MIKRSYYLFVVFFSIAFLFGCSFISISEDEENDKQEELNEDYKVQVSFKTNLNYDINSLDVVKN